MRNFVNIIDGTPDGPVMNKHQYHKIDDKLFQIQITYQSHSL